MLTLKRISMRDFFIFIIILIGCNVHCELIPKCTCNEVKECHKQMVNLVKPCADRCQQRDYKLKGNYEMVKNCVLQNEEKISQTINCTLKTFQNACAEKTGEYVEKTYIETLEIAALAELNRILGEFAQPLDPLIGVGRRFLRCSRKCIDHSSKHCNDHFKCGLSLPNTSEMIQTVKHCAISSGFNNIVIQQMCFCFSSADVKGLEDVCPRLQIL